MSAAAAASEGLAPSRLDDVTCPGEGSTVARDLLSRYLRRTLAKLGELAPRRFHPQRAAEVELVRRLVGELLQREPGVVMSLLRRPTYGVLIHCVHDALARSSGPASAEVEAWAGELCEQTLFALALSRKLSGAHELSRPVASLSSLSHDLLLRFSPPADAVRFGAGRLEYRIEGQHAWLDLALPEEAGGPVTPQALLGLTVEHPFPRLRAGFALTLFDNNPLSMLEAHPEKRGNAVALDDHPLREWTEMLDASFALVEQYLPRIAEEMRLVLHQLVPVGYHPERHFSASYKESVGTVYLSLHPNLLTMTEALIHEFQHNKLAMLVHLDPILHNAFFPLFKSPVRPDPRPLHGVLLAVHAFQPVAKLYEAMFLADDPRVAGRLDVLRRYAQVRKVNRDGCAELLPNAVPTPVGRLLLAETARLNDYFAGLEADPARVEGQPLDAASLGPARDPADH